MYIYIDVDDVVDPITISMTRFSLARLKAIVELG